MSSLRPFLFLLISLLAVGAESLEYSDLQILGAACNDARDSCLQANRRNFTSRNCECDRHCGSFRDCCIDAPSTHQRPTLQRLHQACVAFRDGYQGAYMVDRCPGSYVNADVKRKCQSANDFKDPVMSAPTTDVANRLNYKNRYCAECNGVLPGNLKSWLILNDCPSLNLGSNDVNDSFIWRNIRYNASEASWGVKNNGQFHKCDLYFDLPPYLAHHIRLCRPNLITTCARDWNRPSVRKDCEAYEGAVYHQGRAYKNAHCAVCNKITVVQMSCENQGVIQRKRNPFSFAMLLDVNESDGGQVGVVNRCPHGQKYDPYFKKCRPLSCALPGYIMMNGRCIRP